MVLFQHSNGLITWIIWGTPILGNIHMKSTQLVQISQLLVARCCCIETCSLEDVGSGVSHASGSLFAYELI